MDVVAFASAQHNPIQDLLLHTLTLNKHTHTQPHTHNPCTPTIATCNVNQRNTKQISRNIKTHSEARFSATALARNRRRRRASAPTLRWCWAHMCARTVCVCVVCVMCVCVCNKVRRINPSIYHPTRGFNRRRRRSGDGGISEAIYVDALCMCARVCARVRVCLCVRARAGDVAGPKQTLKLFPKHTHRPINNITPQHPGNVWTG